MTQFLGTHQNRLDAKGRVSVPAAFRAVLRAQPNGNGNGDAPAALVLRPSHKHPCIEAWPTPLFETLAGKFERLELFSETYDDLATTLFPDAYPVETDREGRIVLPEPLVEHAGLTDTVVFMGLGDRFQIWEPEAARRRRLEARERVRAEGLTLPSAARAG